MCVLKAKLLFFIFYLFFQKHSLKLERKAMTKDCPEIKSVWSPESGKGLVWDYELLTSVISAGHPGGHRLLDCFVRAAKPNFYPELVDYVLAGQSLYFECIGMHIEKGSDKIILVDTVSKESAQIKKDTFLKLIANLGQDFKTKFASTLKDFTSDGEESLADSLREMVAKVENYLKAGTSDEPFNMKVTVLLIGLCFVPFFAFLDFPILRFCCYFLSLLFAHVTSLLYGIVFKLGSSNIAPFLLLTFLLYGESLLRTYLYGGTSTRLPESPGTPGHLERVRISQTALDGKTCVCMPTGEVKLTREVGSPGW